AGGWKPIVFLNRHHSHEEIKLYYRAADFCLVTSLHDGMNLVAKEYAAARHDDQGSLILSRFTGASHELADALAVNPYDTAELAEQLAGLDIRDYPSLAELRGDLRRIVTGYCETHPAEARVSGFEPFYFSESIAVTVPLDVQAGTLAEFREALTNLSHDTFY